MEGRVAQILLGLRARVWNPARLNDARGGAGLIEVEHRRCCRRRAAWPNTLFYSTVYFPRKKKKKQQTNEHGKSCAARKHFCVQFRFSLVSPNEVEVSGSSVVLRIICYSIP